MEVKGTLKSLLSDIRIKYNTFSKAQKRLADYILCEPEKVTLLSITELAGKGDTSETTVMRLLKKLEYDSYQVFRINLAKELTEKPGETLNEELSEEDGLATIKKKVIKHNVTAINDLEQTLSEDTIAEFLEFLAASKRVLFFGVGASASISQDALHKFGDIGINVCSHPDPHQMNIICAHSTPDDLFIAVSHTGESQEVLNAVSIARKNGSKIISLTSYSNSSLAKMSDLYLLSSTNDKKYHSEAMASRIVQLTIIDILYIATFMQNEDVYFEEMNKSRIAVALNKT